MILVAPMQPALESFTRRHTIPSAQTDELIESHPCTDRCAQRDLMVSKCQLPSTPVNFHIMNRIMAKLLRNANHLAIAKKTTQKKTAQSERGKVQQQEARLGSS